VLRPIKVKFGVPKAPAQFEVAAMTEIESFPSNAIPWDYTAETRRKGKTKIGETIAAQGMNRIGRVYTPEHLAESSR